MVRLIIVTTSEETKTFSFPVGLCTFWILMLKNFFWLIGLLRPPVVSLSPSVPLNFVLHYGNSGSRSTFDLGKRNLCFEFQITGCCFILLVCSFSQQVFSFQFWHFSWHLAEYLLVFHIYLDNSSIKWVLVVVLPSPFYYKKPTQFVSLKTLSKFYATTFS